MQKNRALIPFFLLASFFWSGCASKALIEARRNDKLKDKAYEMVEKHLKANLKKGDYLWAATKAKAFVNGAKVRIGDQSLTYSYKGAKHWQNRLHVVDAEVEIFNQDTKTVLNIKYTYKEAHPKKIELQLNFIYGFPGPQDYEKKNWIALFRQRPKILRALKERKVYIGMPESVVKLSKGEPDSVETIRSARGEEKKLIYGRQVIHIVNGRIVKREHL